MTEHQQLYTLDEDLKEEEMYKYCPYCKTELVVNGDNVPACTVCQFAHYDNPIPVVALLIPMSHAHLQSVGISTLGIPDNGVVLVRRKMPPFVGEWCLPCGFISARSNPHSEGVKEAKEETGLVVSLEKLLWLRNPRPGIENRIVISYLARPTGGILEAGDDASEVRVFQEHELPKICFSMHEELVRAYFSGALGGLTGTNLIP